MGFETSKHSQNMLHPLDRLNIPYGIWNWAILTIIKKPPFVWTYPMGFETRTFHETLLSPRRVWTYPMGFETESVARAKISVRGLNIPYGIWNPAYFHHFFLGGASLNIPYGIWNKVPAGKTKKS